MKKHLLFAVFVSLQILSFAIQPFSPGIYTIGGKSPSFMTIQQAIDSLNIKGISGKVVFNIRPGIYDEHFVIRPFYKSTMTDSVIIQSETGHNYDVIISHNSTSSATNNIARFDTTSNIVIRNLTFKSINPVFYQQIVLNHTKNIVFDGNSFIAPETNDVSFSTGIMYSDNASLDTGIVIRKNNFYGGYRGIMIHGDNLPGNPSSGIIINENTFINQSFESINISFMSDILITKNKIHISKPELGSSAIRVSNSIVKSIIEVSNNTIKGAKINVFVCVDPGGQKIKIFNNRVASPSTCIDIGKVKGALVYHNSVHSASSAVADAGIALFSDTLISLKNNLIMSPGGSVMITANCFNMGVDYNCYVSSPSFFSVSPSATTLAAWKSVTGGFDMNSISIGTPIFIDNDPSMLKLAPGNPSIIKSSMNFNNDVPVDFEGQFRSNTPFYGADEFVYAGTPQSFLKGVVTYGTDTVRTGQIMLYADSSNNKRFDVIATAFIDNRGMYEINNFTRRNYILRVIPDSLQYPDLIPTYFGGEYEWDKVSFFQPDSNKYTVVNINVIQMTAMAKGSGKISGYIYEDGSLKTNDPIPGLDIILDKIPPASTVKMTKTDANGYYEFDELPDGKYNVKTDMAGMDKDSLYVVDIDGSTSVMSDMNYCVDTVIYTCKESSAVKEVQKSESQITIFPNPFSEFVKISLTDEGKHNIVVYDIIGNQVMNKAVNSKNVFELNTFELPSGIYVVKVVNSEVSQEFKVIKR